MIEPEILSCPICYKLFDQGDHLPRLIPLCGHTVCSVCLMTILNSKEEVQCPLNKKSDNIKQTDLEKFQNKLCS